MLSENILTARQQSGLTQEQLAERCHVVRQTVAKWENGRSIPDAMTLMMLAEALNVTIPYLLGTEDTETALRQELTALQSRAALQEKAGRTRGIILLLCIAALMVSFRAGESLLGLLTVGGCLLLSLAVLWRDLPTLTHVTTPDADLRPIRIATIVSVLVVGGAVLLAVLLERGIVTLSEAVGKALLVGLLAGLMAFFGWLGPKLPFNRHTGLRLPWTVADADTWYLAHRVMGWMGLPSALLYAAAAYVFPDFGVVTAIALGIYIGVPGLLSGVFYWKKMTGRA